MAIFINALGDECLFEIIAFRERADVGLLLLGLVVHEHVVVLDD